MERLYPNEIEFHNDNPPYLDEQNLNSMSHAIAGIDRRVIDTMGDVAQTGVFARQYAEEARQIRSENQAMTAQVYAARSRAEQAMYRAEASESHAYSHMTQARAAATEAQSAAENAAENAATEAAAKAATKAAEDVRAELDDIKSGAELAAENAAASEADAAESARLARETAENIGAVIHPKGSVLFENLPAVESMAVGDMYNILDDFTTTDDFIIGAGKFYVLGTNVYKTQGGLLDVFAGAPVTGIKGNAEEEYRQGNVNITAANIGALEKVNPKGVGKFSVGHDTLAYGEGSHAENGYSIATYNYSCSVTSIEIADNVATIGINVKSTINLKTLWIYSLSRTTTADIIYKSISVKASNGETTLLNFYTDYIVKYLLETDEQKTDISNVSVGDTLYLFRRGVSAIGNNSHAEGCWSVASGESSHAEGYSTIASGMISHAEGDNTNAIGRRSHAEGDYSTASGESSHAEGASAKASGDVSHAEGSYTTASGKWSHAEGSYSKAEGNFSHAQNQETIAKGNSQTAIGKYNVEDTTSALIVGNGTSSSARSNAMTMDWDGNVNLAGTVDAQGFTVNGEPIKGGGSGERVDLPIYRVTLNPTTTSAITYDLTIDDFKVPCMLVVDVDDNASVNYAYFLSTTPFNINTKKCYYSGVTSGNTQNGTTRNVYINKKSFGGSGYYKQRLFLISESKYSADYPYQAMDMTPYYVDNNSYPSNYVYNDTTSTNSTYALNTSKSFQTSKTDLTAGSSTLANGTFYVVYE